jgi:beta-galactosidase
LSGSWAFRFSPVVAEEPDGPVHLAAVRETPYVRRQDNGNRAEFRWAELGEPAGHGIRVEGDPAYNLVARRRSDQQLAGARHRTDLHPEPVIHLYTDHAVQGLGTAAVGPGVLPEYRLDVRPAELTLTLQPLPGRDRAR